MWRDITTVIWKEMQEILYPEGRMRGSVKSGLVFLTISGVLFPLQAGPSWFTSWGTVFSSCFPLMLVITNSTDAFAGERERHTLETLLASRLDDRAILLGKLLSAVLYGWGAVLACLPLSVATINISNRGTGFLFFDFAILSATTGISLLAALLIASMGILISLSAPTVRVAGQRMLLPFIALAGLPAGLPYLMRKLNWSPMLLRATPPLLAALFVAACGLIALVCLGVALKRCTRERLVLT